MGKKKRNHLYASYPQPDMPSWNSEAGWHPNAWGQPPLFTREAHENWGQWPAYPPHPTAYMPHNAGMGPLGWFGNKQMEQFILGVLLGGTAAYVLGDADKRARLMRMLVKLYTGIAGSVEEFKEQIADLKAEVAAEQQAGSE